MQPLTNEAKAAILATYRERRENGFFGAILKGKLTNRGASEAFAWTNGILSGYEHAGFDVSGWAFLAAVQGADTLFEGVARDLAHEIVTGDFQAEPTCV